MVRGRGYPPGTRSAGEPPSDDTAGEQAASLELSTPTPHVQQFLMPYWALNSSPAHDFAPVPAAKGRSGSPDSVIDLDLARDIGRASMSLVGGGPICHVMILSQKCNKPARVCDASRLRAQ